jgi:hypothetical protein
LGLVIVNVVGKENVPSRGRAHNALLDAIVGIHRLREPRYVRPQRTADVVKRLDGGRGEVALELAQVPNRETRQARDVLQCAVDALAQTAQLGADEPVVRRRQSRRAPR